MLSLSLISGLIVLGFLIGLRFQFPALLVVSIATVALTILLAVSWSWPLYLGMLTCIGALSLLQASYLSALLVRQRIHTHCAKRRTTASRH
jgi:hypothetical protein